MTDNTATHNLIKKEHITVIAGPCAIENWEQLDETAKVVSDLKLSYLRGGAYKPRTSPYSFQGLEEKGLKFLKKVGEKYGLKTVTEVTDTVNAEIVAIRAILLLPDSHGVRTGRHLRIAPVTTAIILD